MASDTISDDGLQPDKIEFVQYHQPGLKDGDYEIRVDQELHTNESDQQKIFPTIFTSQKNFTVSGERFELKPADIQTVFPPEGSLGEHSNVLPHIILNRSTLPWERMADKDREDIPWLVLLLFDGEEKLSGAIEKQDFLTKYAALNQPTIEGEAAWNHLLDGNVGWLKARNDQTGGAVIRAKERRASQNLNDAFAGLQSQIETILDQSRTPQILRLNDLTKQSGDALKWPGVQLEAGQHIDDKVTVIDVEKSLLEQMLPLENDLSWLSHVRQGKDAADAVTGDELAVIIGNRLPLKGGSSSVHLVSVEGRYRNGIFDYQDAAADHLIRLVSLKSWSFACLDKKRSFKGLLENLDHNPSALRLPQDAPPGAKEHLSIGCVPLPHYLREGSKTVSWYHGPLISGENKTGITLPVRAADELVRYNLASGIFDVSYAAAWELGRLLALQNKQLSVSLYNWKRTHAQQLKQTAQRRLYAHLPMPEQIAAAIDIPKDIASWFSDLSLLQGVPFNYLVPDERMLPNESIRFIWVDCLWVNCLLDGAFSIGRVTTSDHQQDKGYKDSPAVNPFAQVSGFLLRSDVVSGWPSLVVEAYDQRDPDKGGEQKKLLRAERLSANILLCLFEGEVERIEIHQKPETLHFGLDVHEPDEKISVGYYKTLRDDQGRPIIEAQSPPLNVAAGQPIKIEIGPGSTVWQQESQRSISVSNLARAIQDHLPSAGAFTSAQFALQMIEGVEKVVFQRK
jgi:hypothetical protein